MTAPSYFARLQFRRMHRTLHDLGVNPWVVYVSAPLLFTGGSIALFSRTSYAGWIYVAIAAVALFQLGKPARLDFLRQVFNKPAYWHIRILENTLTVAPFVTFLLFKHEPRFALGLLALAAATLPFRTRPARTVLPTPFSAHPFEFAIGFRNFVGALLIAYLLMAIGVYVGNGQLSIATLLLVVLVCSNYYAWCEPLLYVWVYHLTPTSFLWLKVKTAVWHLTIILLPLLLIAVTFFPGDWLAVLAVLATGYGFLALSVLAKYAAFPRSISIPQGILMAVSLVFPPLLIGSIPYFFRIAKSNISLKI